MSILKVDEILDASGGSNAVLYGPASPAGSMGFRNRIINGDMRIDQRNAGAAITGLTNGSNYAVDRWVTTNTTDGVVTIQQSTTAPTGFNNSHYLTVTTADASLSSTQVCVIRHKIEGFNVADLGWGTASAKTVTLSFQVRSSLTGTFGGVLRNSADDRSYPFTYSISAANTFETKSVTIAGDTSGTWVTNNGVGVQVIFSMGSGSSRVGTAGAWAGAEYTGASGETNVMGTSGATFYITGVQLEVGSVATEFERRPYGTELALCQRYYFTTANDSGNAFGSLIIPSANAYNSYQFKVTMRTSPTLTLVSATGSITDSSSSNSGFYVQANSLGSVKVTASAEL